MEKQTIFNHRLTSAKGYSESILLQLACFLCFLMNINPANAVPVADDLLQACEVSLNNGFQGVVGEMCIWYVTPCDCTYGKAAELPRVCIPDTVPTESLARSVVDGLKAHPELLVKDADFAAAAVLSRIYPCDQ